VSPHLPDNLLPLIEAALAALGPVGRVTRVDPLGGGCVNHASCLTTDRGERFFLKWNARAPAGMFAAEADGLRALAAPRALRVPEVLGVGESGSPPWLLLEYVAAGRPGRDYAARLGEGLAALHRSARGSAERWGWERDNFIGPLDQSNAPTPTWGEFWRDRRLAPQLRQARARGHLMGAEAGVLDRVMERVSSLLADVGHDGPSLLHGDLWGGNVYADGFGQPVLIDPAVHRGHREVDLAMSELFGGFPSGWPRAYDAAWPLDADYAGGRRALYQLYYLLVHVNLFGSGYEVGCLAAAREAAQLLS
jgi:fructosamine-3-kinase